MVDERGYCTDCDNYDCQHAQLFEAQAAADFWKRKATERKVPVYNERYSRSVTMQVGDLERMYMALAVADDYLMWLAMRQELPGSGHGMREQLHDAREFALALYSPYFASDRGTEHG